MNKLDFISEEEIAEAVKSALTSTYTIDELIQEKREEQALINLNFDVTSGNLKQVNNNRKTLIKRIINARNITVLATFLIQIIDNNVYYEIERLTKNINNNVNKLKSEKELLITLKKSLQELKKYNSCDCNYDINELLVLLNDKNGLIYDIVIDEIKNTSTRIKGFDIISSTANEEKLKDLENDINNVTLKLGINKN